MPLSSANSPFTFSMDYDNRWYNTRMAEHQPITKVETIIESMPVRKPDLAEIINDPENQAYFQELGRPYGPVLGWLVKKIASARYRREIKRDLDRIKDGETVDVPMVHTE